MTEKNQGLSHPALTEITIKEKTNEDLFALYAKENDPEQKDLIRKELTLRYMYIVKAVAVQMHDLYANFAQTEDIINEGILELMRGIDRYRPERDNKFDSFISRRIRGMVIDYIRKNDWMPRSFHKECKTIEEARSKLAAQYGRTPTDTEVAREIGMEQDHIRKVDSMRSMVNVLSLDMTFDESDDAMLQVPTDDILAQPEKYYIKKETVRLLAKGVESLSDKEKMIISLYYVDNLNMTQIAEVMEISQPRVSQLHTQAIRKLKKYMMEHAE